MWPVLQAAGHLQETSSKMSILVRRVVVMSAVLFLTALIFGQVTTDADSGKVRITGRVVDTSGSVIPTATVILKSIPGAEQAASGGSL